MQDLTGLRFGRWTVIGIGERSAAGKIQWLCRCDCGTERNVLADALRAGQSKSCGCSKRKYKDISGQRFGNLVAIKPVSKRSKNGSVNWLCNCDCGKTTIVDGAPLRRGVQVSCGCMRVERLNAIDRTKIDHKTHGGSGSKYCQRERLYRIWSCIIQRCYNQNNNAYKYYGGRGIKMYDVWRNDYSEFRNWAMNNGYNPDAEKWECTIDRIDNNGNYTPDNCRFVDMKMQASNKRKRGTALVGGI